MCDRIHYDELDNRVTALEASVAELRNETKQGLSALNGNIETLSQQIANMDARLIEERVKWHDVFRSLVKWSMRAGIIIVTYAAGVNLTDGILPKILK